MKEIISILFSFFFYLYGLSQNYYVSSSMGNDNNDGTSPSRAWKSLDKVNNASIKAGTIIALKGEDEFYGNLIINSKKGTRENPIEITSYGSGKALIRGSQIVPIWTKMQGNIWEANIASAYQVFFDGVGGINARYPDLTNSEDNPKNYLRVASVQNRNKIFSCTSLIGRTDLIGASIYIRTAPFERELRTIIAFNSDTGQLTLDNPTLLKIDIGEDFWIQDHFNLLSTNNEWYHNRIKGKLYIYSSKKPMNIGVVTNSNHAISIINSSFIIFENLQIIGFNAHGIRISGGACNKINNCDISYAHEAGIRVLSSNENIISNNFISHIAKDGVILEDSDDVIVEKNTIQNHALLREYFPFNAVRGSSPIYISYHSLNAIVRENRIQNTGFNGIYGYKVVNALIDGNYIKNTMLNMEDGGGIYVFTGESNKITTISNNIILGYSDFNDSDWDSMGIYLDDGAHNIVISGNGLSENHRSLFLHNTTNIEVSNNNIHSNKREGVLIKDDAIVPGPSSSDIRFVNNQVLLSSKKYLPVQIDNMEGPNYSMITFENNKYFNPYSAYSVGIHTTDIHSAFSLSEWKTISNQDAKSIDDSGYEISGSLFVYNETVNEKGIILEGAWQDLAGISFVGNISLEPFTCKILISVK